MWPWPPARQNQYLREQRPMDPPQERGKATATQPIVLDAWKRVLVWRRFDFSVPKPLYYVVSVALVVGGWFSNLFDRWCTFDADPVVGASRAWKPTSSHRCQHDRMTMQSLVLRITRPWRHLSRCVSFHCVSEISRGHRVRRYEQVPGGSGRFN